MKTLRASAGYAPYDKHYDERKLRQLDAEQNRRRLNADEKDGLYYVAVASMLASNGLAMVDKHATHSGQHRRLTTATSMLHNAMREMSNHVQSEQLITIANNVNHTDVILSSRPVDGCLNIPYRHMQAITNQALQTCELLCTADREESKTCPMRKALECVPGMKGAARERAKLDSTKCPYAGLTMEMEEEKHGEE